MKNPLLTPYSGNYNTIPFNSIKISDYKPAILEGIERGKKDIESIKATTADATFENTIVPYERGGELLGAVSSIFFNLNSANTTDEVQALARELSPLLTAYSNEIQLDEVLFERIKQAHDTADRDELSEEDIYLMDKIYRSFVRNGANLSDANKTKLKDINTQLSELKLKFGENVLKDSNQYELWLDDENDLDGLPKSAKDAAKLMAKEKGKPEKWLVNLDYPSYLPFMKYATNRDLRKALFMAFGKRGYNSNELNNESTLKKIAALRQEKAELLGYQSHAAFTLEERMAKKPEKVIALWDELLEVALPKAKTEIAEVAALATTLDGIEKMERWDFSYYAEKLKLQKFALNDELLKPYFQLEKVIAGAFLTAEKLFDLKFIETDEIEKYHPDVQTFIVKDGTDNHVAILYADFFPRSSKRNGAWMTSYKGQNHYDDVNQRPIISIVCNFTKPTDSAPSLLTFNEVTTLFHEFGHALHGMLANGKYQSLSGTSVFWDFVELPSQLMENWCYEPACLDLFAKHYETGEAIPVELVQKIKDSMNFLSAYQTVRQVSLGQLDMAWHNGPVDPELSVFDLEEKSGEPTALFDTLQGIVTSTAFSHIFSGGYSAGYYSYKWAEVLEADAFAYFKEKGIFNEEVAEAFKTHILTKGGSADPMELYKKFRGQAPNPEALLRKSGLI